MGPVHMNEVRCSGFEKSITECQFNKDALGCSHEEDAAVRCNVPAMGFQEMVITHALNHTIGPKTFRIFGPQACWQEVKRFFSVASMPPK